MKAAPQPSQREGLVVVPKIRRGHAGAWVDDEAQGGKHAGAVKYSPRAVNDPNKTTIKQQIASVAKALNAMDVVAAVTAPDISKWPAQRKKEWALETLKASGYKIDIQSFGVVEIGKNQIETSLTYLDEPGELAAFACVPRVLKRGIQLAGHEDHKGRKFETVTFAAPVTINGVRGNMAVVVKKLDRNLYKTHRILMPDGSAFEFSEQQKTEVGLLDGIPQQEAQGQDANSATDSLQQTPSLVNGKIQKSVREETVPVDELPTTRQFSGRDQTETEAFKRWFGDSKVVNEDGTPRVMYVDTNKKRVRDWFHRLGNSSVPFAINQYRLIRSISHSDDSVNTEIQRSRRDGTDEDRLEKANAVEGVQFSRREGNLLSAQEYARVQSAWVDYTARGYKFFERNNGGIIVDLDSVIVYTDDEGTPEYVLEVGTDDRWSTMMFTTESSKWRRRASAMKCNTAYLKAVLAKQVPVSVLAENALALEGKTEQEQDEMREAWAKEIMAKYPDRKK